MIIKKIVAKNFIVPGVQTYEFDNLGGLVGGGYYSLNELPILQDLLNGKWNETTISFEQYYPKFANTSSDMDLEVDAMLVLEDKDLEELNKVVVQAGYKPQKSKIWFFTIKCFYPYIFPIINLRPHDDSKDNIFSIGSHYEKFTKSNSSKRDLLTVAGIHAVAQFRQAYYQYKKMKVEPENKDLQERYLKLLKSIFRYDEHFIKRIGKVVYNIEDGDVIQFGDQFDFFYANKNIQEWLNSIELLNESPEIRLDFARLIYEFFLKDLQWVYTVKTSNEVIEIKQILNDNFCENNIDFRLIQKLFNFTLSDEPLELFSNSDNGEFDVNIKSDGDTPEDKKAIKTVAENDGEIDELVEQFKILQRRQDAIVGAVSETVDEINLEAELTDKSEKQKRKEAKQAEKLKKVKPTKKPKPVKEKTSKATAEKPEVKDDMEVVLKKGKPLYKNAQKEQNKKEIQTLKDKYKTEVRTVIEKSKASNVEVEEHQEDLEKW